MTWHYRNADPEFGKFQAKELHALLESMQERLAIDVLVGKKNLEVRPAEMNKGAIVRRLIEETPQLDFALCAGDDKTDEGICYCDTTADSRHVQGYACAQEYTDRRSSGTVFARFGWYEQANCAHAVRVPAATTQCAHLS